MILWFKKIFQYIIGLFILPKKQVLLLQYVEPLKPQEKLQLHTHPYKYMPEYKSENPPKNIFINVDTINKNKTVMDDSTFNIKPKPRKSFKTNGLVPMFHCPICKGIVISTYDDNIWKCRTCKKEEHIIWFSNRAKTTLQFSLIHWIGEENEI